jgi:Ni/Co efflux regulator RcnB
MRSLIFSGVALAALIMAQPAMAAIDSGVGAPPLPQAIVQATPAVAVLPAPAMRAVQRDVQAPPLAMPVSPPPPVTADGRWIGGHSAPGGWTAYRRPSYGYQLPEYWMTPSFHMADYLAYGLDRPARGFGWSRYYDDAVLTDQWGRVYDTRSNYDWDRRGSGRGRRGGHDGDAATAGIGGAAVGAVAGNLIAGAGSRLAGSLIGGGVGALAGLAIEAATSKHRRDHRGYNDRDYGRNDDYRDRDRGYGAHWGGDRYGYAPNGGEIVTTTVVTQGGCGCTMVPRQVVSYENVYAPAAVRTKTKERRTTKGRPRVRGDY